MGKFFASVAIIRSRFFSMFSIYLVFMYGSVT
jgi:hypothetical protein